MSQTRIKNMDISLLSRHVVFIYTFIYLCVNMVISGATLLR